jgi:hypothetical protein
MSRTTWRWSRTVPRISTASRFFRPIATIDSTKQSRFLSWSSQRRPFLPHQCAKQAGQLPVPAGSVSADAGLRTSRGRLAKEILRNIDHNHDHGDDCARTGLHAPGEWERIRDGAEPEQCCVSGSSARGRSATIRVAGVFDRYFAPGPHVPGVRCAGADGAERHGPWRGQGQELSVLVSNGSDVWAMGGEPESSSGGGRRDSVELPGACFPSFDVLC